MKRISVETIKSKVDVSKKTTGSKSGLFETYEGMGSGYKHQVFPFSMFGGDDFYRLSEDISELGLDLYKAYDTKKDGRPFEEWSEDALNAFISDTQQLSTNEVDYFKQMRWLLGVYSKARREENKALIKEAKEALKEVRKK